MWLWERDKRNHGLTFSAWLKQSQVILSSQTELGSVVQTRGSHALVKPPWGNNKRTKGCPPKKEWSFQCPQSQCLKRSKEPKVRPKNACTEKMTGTKRPMASQAGSGWRRCRDRLNHSDCEQHPLGQDHWTSRPLQNPAMPKKTQVVKPLGGMRRTVGPRWGMHKQNRAEDDPKKKFSTTVSTVLCGSNEIGSFGIVHGK